jgi:hypothetical protein
VPQSGQQHYFLLKGIPIWMSHATMVPASCRGILCNWQQPPNCLVQCGCMFTSHQAAIVLQVHVTFDYIMKMGRTRCTQWTTIAHGRWPNILYLQWLWQLIALHFIPLFCRCHNPDRANEIHPF